MNINVLHILNGLGFGGTELLLLDICRQSNIHGIRISVLSAKDGILKERFKELKIPFTISSRENIWAINYILQIRKVVRSGGINLIHAHQPIDALYACMATLGLGIKIILTHHGYKSTWRANLILTLIIRRVDMHVFVTKGFLQRFLNDSPFKKINNSKIIYNGIDFTRLNSQNKNFRINLGISQSATVLGMVGNFVPWKDQMTILKAISIVVKNNLNIMLLLIGSQDMASPGLYDNCVIYCKENNLENHVKFLGSRSDIGDILHGLDLFIFSSVEDTFGIAGIEAIFAGIPTIMSNIPPFNEISDYGKYTIFFEPRNEKDLASKIDYYLENKEIIESNCNNAKKWVSKEFSVEKHLYQLKKTYSELLVK
jgi:glycosyltransferase involved in cell wall biosynthesis